MTKTIEQRCADMERTVEQMLTMTRYGDHRPAYRNMATGKLSTPFLSDLEIEAKRKSEQ